MAKAKLAKYSDIQRGDIMAVVNFVKVEDKVAYQDTLLVRDLDTNVGFRVEGKDLIEQTFSADRYSKEEKVTRTEMAEKLISSHNRPFTVVFEKVSGEERTLRGRLLSAEPLMGRSNVEDLDITSGTPLRLVDHRTLKSLIVDGTKYILKK